MSTSPTTSSGTAFYIQGNFSAGNTYEIEITTKNGFEGMLLKTAVVNDINQFKTKGNTSCISDDNVPNYSTSSYGDISAYVPWDTKVHTSPAFSISGSQTYPYLVIWAFGGKPSASLLDYYITKVVIKKTPLVSFTLPSMVSVTCGSAAPQNFTVVNGNNTPNVTAYEWNLGSTNNGWLFNGSPAGQFITSTTNTLTLTPSCGNALGNISAKVTAGGVNYSTNTMVVNMTTPALSISGPDNFCSSGIYSISNLPCNASVSWSASPIGVVSLSGGNSVIMSRITDGTATLNATVTACGKTVTLSKANVRVGASPVTLSATQLDCNMVRFAVSGTYASSYTWSSSSGNMLFNGSSTTATTTEGQIEATSTGGTVSVNTVNVCGQAATARVDYFPFSKTIQYGSYLPLLSGDQLSVSIDPIPYATNYTWYVNGTMVLQGADVTAYSTCYGSQDPVLCGNNTLSLEVKTTCGTQYYYSEFEKACYYSMQATNVSVYPNPAREQIAIQLKEDNDKSVSVKLKDIRYVRVIDKKGMMRKVFIYAAGTKSLRQNLNGLPTDVYTLEVTDGTNKASLHISVMQ